MRHQKKRNKLSRDAGHRKALIRNLCAQVLQHERVQTSQAKAKVIKPEVEKLITLAKRGDLHARRQALAELNQDKFVVHKLFEEIAPRYVGAARRLHAHPEARAAAVGFDRDGLSRARLVGQPLSGRPLAAAQAHARVPRRAASGLGGAAWAAHRRGRALGRARDTAPYRSPRLSVAGRTDTGVHARGQVVSFACEEVETDRGAAAVAQRRPAARRRGRRCRAGAGRLRRAARCAVADLLLSRAGAAGAQSVLAGSGAVVAAAARRRRARASVRRLLAGNARLHRLHAHADRARALRAGRVRGRVAARAATCSSSGSRPTRSCGTWSACWSGRCSRSCAGPRDGRAVRVPAARERPAAPAGRRPSRMASIWRRCATEPSVSAAQPRRPRLTLLTLA